MNQIGVLKEKNGDPRVALVPVTVKSIISQFNYTIFVEKGAGIEAGAQDEDYIKAGAQIVSREEVIEKSDTLIAINQFEVDHITTDKTIISIINPLFHHARLSLYSNKPIRLYSLDLMPRTSKAQSMDVLSSMASLAGYKAVLKASELSSAVIPMFTTAAGTVKPGKVLIIGAGVAGLQAIATARRLGAIVDAFDVRKAASEEIQSLGANFIEVEGAEEKENAGGYAIQQSEDYIEKQKELIDKYASQASVIICTANIPGRKAPLLIERSSVEKMKAGGVIIDLAAEQGGNCEVTKNNELISLNGVKILGASHLAAELPVTASQLLSTNYFNFIKHLRSTTLDGIQNDTIIEDCLVIDDGKLVNERVKTYMV
jgi:NAD(P) transhydrogenase subunit alpha